MFGRLNWGFIVVHGVLLTLASSHGVDLLIYFFFLLLFTLTAELLVIALLSQVLVILADSISAAA